MLRKSDHAAAPVEEAALVLSGLTRESGVLMNLLTNLRGDRERRLSQAERQLQARTSGRLVLHGVVRVAPGPGDAGHSGPPDPSIPGSMKPLSLPCPVDVREGPGSEPMKVRLGERWQRR